MSPRSIWGLTKDEEITKINKAVVDMANNFKLGVDEPDIEEALEGVPEELTNEELLRQGQERTADEEAREKETAEEKNLQENSE